MPTQTINRKEIRPRLQFAEDTIARLVRIAAKERRDLAAVLELAAEEIADRGYTDKVVVKGRI